MKLLILTQYYPPEMGAPQNRLHDLAKRLVGWGHQVEVLTALPNYPGREIFEKYRGRANQMEILDGVRVFRVNIHVPKDSTYAQRLLNYLSFPFYAIRDGTRLVSRPDLILMESPPLFTCLAAWWLRWRLKARLVTNISDLWPKTVVDMGFVKPGVFLWGAQKLEAWMYGASDLITGQTEGIVDDIRKRFPQKKVELFLNGVDVEQYSRSVSRDEVRSELGWAPTDFVVGYTGVIGFGKALDQVLDAAKKLEDLSGFHFALIGDGPLKEHLERRIRDEKIKKIRFYGPYPRDKMVGIQAALDMGLVSMSKANVFKGARPSKMLELMAAAKPIILFFGEGEASDLLQAPSAGPAGFVVPAEDSDQLAETVRLAISRRSQIHQMGEGGRDFIFSRLSRESIAREVEQKFISLNRNPNA